MINPNASSCHSAASPGFLTTVLTGYKEATAAYLGVGNGERCTTILSTPTQFLTRARGIPEPSIVCSKPAKVCFLATGTLAGLLS
ncbi:uncharacterized protein METZ01_LOCUS140210 [marine metagenome]|uniref:Uncharacterized protein n=1 Tax=marine metagenome TaxID=408172 RepID=A0A381ZDM7_9ZZZZ